MVTKNCEICGATFDHEPIMHDGREVFAKTKCDPCIDANDRKVDSECREARHRALTDNWHQVCPPLYRDTDLGRIPAEYLTAVKAWRFGPRGVGFSGEAGKCKTRSAFQILKAQVFDGKTCEAVSATKLAMYCVDQFSNDGGRKAVALAKMEAFHRVKVLLLDDLGKGKMTERAEMELFDILETRTSNLLPTIWTVNAGAEGLRSMMSEDRGDPIMRRLVEFTDIISLP